MKKKILFIMPSMFIDGAERSLLGLLGSIDYSNYEVSLFLYRHEGEFLELIPKEVQVLSVMPEYGTFDVPIKELLLSKKWKYGVARLWAKFSMKIHCIKEQENTGVWMAMQYISKSLLPLLPKIPGKYDIGISFLGVPDVLIERVDAKVKVAWNHTDYTVLNPNKKRDRELYSKIDYIASVSTPCTEKFVQIYPEFKDKAITIENLLDTNLLENQANEVREDLFPNKKGKVLLSVGRYSDAKNFDNVPDICKSILETGIKVTWYIIGYGGEEGLIQKRIKEANMEQNVILLGKKSNPYPYIKGCDLYIQPSRYEGKAVTVREAQILHKPVVITNFATSASQLQDGYDGIIVPMKNEECAMKIVELLKDEKRMNQLIDNTYKNDYSNRQELEKLYALIK